MTLKEHFHWLLPQTVVAQDAGQMLHRAMLKKNSLQPLRKGEPQRFLQLVLQRFWSLQGMSHCAMIRATCLAMMLRDKLHEKLHSVTPPYNGQLEDLTDTKSNSKIQLEVQLDNPT